MTTTIRQSRRFGSASIRLIGNQTSAALVLATPQGGTPTIPNPAVAVLPVQQPNRDFYRFGVGINLLDVFTKLKGGPSAAPAAVTPAPATTPTDVTGSGSKAGSGSASGKKAS